MNLSKRIVILLVIVYAVLCFTKSTSDAAERNIVGICIRNCAQCSKLFGPFFQGSKCADLCVKYKGKLIPDCEDEFSIRPFLQAPENDY